MNQCWGHAEYNPAFSLTLQCSYINTTMTLSLHPHQYDTFITPTPLWHFRYSYTITTLSMHLHNCDNFTTPTPLDTFTTPKYCKHYRSVLLSVCNGVAPDIEIKGTPVPAPRFLRTYLYAVVTVSRVCLWIASRCTSFWIGGILKATENFCVLYYLGSVRNITSTVHSYSKTNPNTPLWSNIGRRTRPNPRRTHKWQAGKNKWNYV
jgi:hypothetical protein